MWRIPIRRPMQAPRIMNNSTLLTGTKMNGIPTIQFSPIAADRSQNSDFATLFVSSKPFKPADICIVKGFFGRTKQDQPLNFSSKHPSRAIPSS
mmetsp:Transcript_14142/g.28566  ORF Transcript_14142/g.28566 Transcript_14142/m.28566 type:complete len:94 (+) Transcript_14142:1153-1434(+)